MVNRRHFFTKIGAFRRQNATKHTFRGQPPNIVGNLATMIGKSLQTLPTGLVKYPSARSWPIRSQYFLTNSYVAEGWVVGGEGDQIPSIGIEAT